MRHRSLQLLTGTLALTPIAAPIAIATEYLSIEQAQRLVFPLAERFQETTLTLSAEQQRAVAQLAGPQPRHGTLRVWRAFLGDRTLGYFFVDEVIGRQDLITYAIGIDASGKLSDMEVLAYRESHGGEIRNAAWRRQFAGRDDLQKLQFQIDIKNIAGATLSCQHVTQGIRWLRALWEAALRSA
jgi:Na+-translocating ferredoxin:NAD+ oxidoreductase RnfG subunit